MRIHKILTLEKIQNLLKYNWFHGDISTDEAVDRLLAKDVGTFLVRFSTSSFNSFTISKVKELGMINHLRIQRVFDDENAEWFMFDHRKYRTLEELINTESDTLGLFFPCTGSKFFSLFHDITSKGDYVGSYLSDNTMEF